MSNKDKVDEFRKELKELLEKYHTYIFEMSQCYNLGTYDVGLGVHIDGEDVRISSRRFTSACDLEDEDEDENQCNESQ